MRVDPGVGKSAWMPPTTIAILGAKGGVGASLVAQNAALEIAHQQNVDVLLADLDMHFGTAKGPIRLVAPFFSTV